MAEKHNIVFLDIDGVINKFKLSDDESIITKLDDDTIENLNSLISLTNCKIVISSSWKTSTTYMDILEEELFPRLPTGCVIGCTPTFVPQIDRQYEISAWISKNIDKIRNFVILDDYDFELELFLKLDRCVITDAVNGLTVSDVQTAVDKLSEPLENDVLRASSMFHQSTTV